MVEYLTGADINLNVYPDSPDGRNNSRLRHIFYAEKSYADGWDHLNVPRRLER